MQIFKLDYTNTFIEIENDNLKKFDFMHEWIAKLNLRKQLNKNDKEVLLQNQKYQSSKEILELLKYRFGISHSIERIEAYDNSFFGNNYAVSSYVVFNEDGFSIKDSRTYKFKDYDLKKFGDADLMRKVFEARFSKDDKVLPDIMIIDGDYNEF